MPYSQRQAALKHGWKSGLEERVADSLSARGFRFDYEREPLVYVEPERKRRYTPDFFITTRSGNEIIVETKGRWTREDRMKMRLVVQQHPERDIRFVFQSPNAKINKGSKTTYAMWCERELGRQWAKGDVPLGWLEE